MMVIAAVVGLIPKENYQQRRQCVEASQDAKRDIPLILTAHKYISCYSRPEEWPEKKGCRPNRRNQRSDRHCDESGDDLTYHILIICGQSFGSYISWMIERPTTCGIVPKRP